MTFRAVIFNFDGVITSSPFKAFNRLERERGLPPDLIRSINAASPDSNALGVFWAGGVGMAGFKHAFAEEALRFGHALSGEDVLAGEVRPGMVAATDALKADGYTLGCMAAIKVTDEEQVLGGARKRAGEHAREVNT